MLRLSKEYQGSCYAILSGLLYGLVGYFGVSLMDTDLSISTLQFWRFFTSAVFILVVLLLQFKKIQDNKVAMGRAFLSGAAFYSISSGVYFSATQYIGTGLAMVIFFTFPAFVLLLNRLLYKSTIAKSYYIAVGLIIVGMAQLANLGSWDFDMIGIGLAVITAILYACYIVSSKNIQISPMISTLMISLGCAFSCFFYSVYDQSFVIPHTLYQWEYILGFGILSTALPILLLLRGLKCISAEKASMLSVLEPVFVVIFGILLLEENIAVAQLLGVAIILAGALIALLSNSTKKSAF